MRPTFPIIYAASVHTFPTSQREAPRHEAQVTNADHAPAPESRTNGVRHRLDHSQQREIARLYGDTGASVADIRQRFGISEPTVYRVLQKHSVALRGRTRQPDHPERSDASRKTSSGQGNRQSSSRAGSSMAQPAPGRSSSNSDSGEPTVNYRIEFRVERVLDAVDIRDALNRAEALGATDIVAITRVR